MPFGGLKFRNSHSMNNRINIAGGDNYESESEEGFKFPDQGW
jgi:hypothetical protein